MVPVPTLISVLDVADAQLPPLKVVTTPEILLDVTLCISSCINTFTCLQTPQSAFRASSHRTGVSEPQTLPDPKSKKGEPGWTLGPRSDSLNILEHLSHPGIPFFFSIHCPLPHKEGKDTVGCTA